MSSTYANPLLTVHARGGIIRAKESITRLLQKSGFVSIFTGSPCQSVVIFETPWMIGMARLAMLVSQTDNSVDELIFRYSDKYPRAASWLFPR